MTGWVDRHDRCHAQRDHEAHDDDANRVPGARAAGETIGSRSPAASVATLTTTDLWNWSGARGID